MISIRNGQVETKTLEDLALLSSEQIEAEIT